MPGFDERRKLGGLKVRAPIAWGSAPGAQPQNPGGLKVRAKVPVVVWPSGGLLMGLTSLPQQPQIPLHHPLP